MVYHCEMVNRGAPDALVIGDLPFMSYQEGPIQAVQSAGRLVKEGGCGCVKLEGGLRMAEQIAAIVRADIPVMGHIGLTPQSIHQLGGYRVQRDADRLFADARAVQEAGAWSVVLECVPREIAAAITAQLEIPTIGIGAGPDCSGQVLVFHDILGLYDEKPMRFVRRYADLKTVVTEAVARYREEVESGCFPAAEHCFTVAPSDFQGA
jgi:3-methyl-2-oxobutanoate hydroxymethyltransferase